MTNNSDHNASEENIIRQLEQFQPRPTPQAYRRANETPWSSRDKHGVPNMTTQTLLRVRPLRLIVAALLIVIALSAAIWFTPPLRSWAQDVLNSLFNRAESNTITVAPSNGSGAEVALQDIASVQAASGFEIAQPAYVPDGFTFSGAGYTPDRHAASLFYDRPGAEFVITQQPAQYAEFGLLTDGASGIGPDAPIEIVQLGDISAEYVAGAWIMTSENQAVWNPNAGFQRLRWKSGTMIYEILTAGGSTDTGSAISKDQMVAIAVSLQ